MKLDNDKAYIGSDLWLPKDVINYQYLKNTLTLKEGRKSHKLYRETKAHIIVPRYNISKNDYNCIDCEVIPLPGPIFPRVHFNCNIVLRENQLEAWSALEKQDDGILNLSPGKGKTILALKKAAQLGVPTLITVNTELLIQQWIRFIKEFLEEDDIGIIQGQTCDWRHKICVSMIQTLYRLELPKGFQEHFGFHIVDEGHHMGGIEFGKIGPICQGARLLLSATYRRVDGREDLFKQYFGDIIYTDKGFDLIPEIRFIELDTEYDSEEHSERIVSVISEDKSANLKRAEWIKKLSKGRKSILVGTRVEQLKYLSSLFKGSCVITSATDSDIRVDLINKSSLSFIIDNFGVEALDCPALDTLFMLLPISTEKRQNSDGTVTLLGNSMQQIMGRILRIHPTKKPPLVIIFDDIGVPVLHKQIGFIKTWLKNNNYKFEVLK